MISCTWGEDTEVNRASASSWSQRGTPGKTTNGTQHLPPAPHSTHASDGRPPHGEVMEQRQLPASPNAETHTRNHVLLYTIFWNAPFFKMITNRQWISKREMLGKSEKFWWAPEMGKNQAELREAQPSTVKTHGGAEAAALSGVCSPWAHGSRDTVVHGTWGAPRVTSRHATGDAHDPFYGHGFF